MISEFKFDEIIILQHALPSRAAHGQIMSLSRHDSPYLPRPETLQSYCASTSQQTLSTLSHIDFLVCLVLHAGLLPSTLQQQLETGHRMSELVSNPGQNRGRPAPSSPPTAKLPPLPTPSLVIRLRLDHNGDLPLTYSIRALSLEPERGPQPVYTSSWDPYPPTERM